jgi:hypothetical protein
MHSAEQSAGTAGIANIATTIIVVPTGSHIAEKAGSVFTSTGIGAAAAVAASGRRLTIRAATIANRTRTWTDATGHRTTSRQRTGHRHHNDQKGERSHV